MAIRVLEEGTIEVTGESHYTAVGVEAVIARDNSVVTADRVFLLIAWDNSRVTVRGNSNVNAHDNSHVTAYENSYVIAWGNSRVDLYDNARLDDRRPAVMPKA